MSAFCDNELNAESVVLFDEHSEMSDYVTYSLLFKACTQPSYEP